MLYDSVDYMMEMTVLHQFSEVENKACQSISPSFKLRTLERIVCGGGPGCAVVALVLKLWSVACSKSNLWFGFSEFLVFVLLLLLLFFFFFRKSNPYLIN